MISPLIKEIVGGYINYLDLSDLVVGEVVSVDPITIKVQDLNEPIGMEYLSVPKHLVDPIYRVSVEVPGSNTVSLSGLSITHSLRDEGTVSHSGDNPEVSLTFNGKVDMVIDTKGDIVLSPGDKVYMIMAKGGQKYLVLCKVV